VKPPIDEMTITKVGVSRDEVNSSVLQKSKRPKSRQIQKDSMVESSSINDIREPNLDSVDFPDIQRRREQQIVQALSAATLNTLIVSPDKDDHKQSQMSLKERLFASPNFATSGKEFMHEVFNRDSRRSSVHIDNSQ